MDKIQRPTGIRPSLDQDRRPDADRTAASPALTAKNAAASNVNGVKSHLEIEDVVGVGPAVVLGVMVYGESPCGARLLFPVSAAIT